MSEWISVKDRLPEEEQGECIVWLNYGCALVAWPTYWHGAKTSFAHWTFPHDEDAEETENVTHWMPRPAAPK